MNVTSTTHGNPEIGFSPAIRFGGDLYVKSRSRHTEENEAERLSAETYKDVEATLRGMLVKRGYVKIT